MFVKITRVKQYPTPGKSSRFSWRWLYEIQAPGQPFDRANFDTLGSLKGFLKRKQIIPVYDWEKYICEYCGKNEVKNKDHICISCAEELTDNADKSRHYNKYSG